MLISVTLMSREGPSKTVHLGGGGGIGLGVSPGVGSMQLVVSTLNQALDRSYPQLPSFFAKKILLIVFLYGGCDSIRTPVPGVPVSNIVQLGPGRYVIR